MNRTKEWLKEAAFTLITLIAVFICNIIIQESYDTQKLTPMIFVLGVFLIALKTKGYFWGVTASMLSVLAVNYAFSFPYYAFDLLNPELLFSAIVMLIVAIITGTLTTQIKMQEKMKADTEKERMRSNLLRAVSHDIRTPLTTIYGSSSTIIENYDVLSKEQQLNLLKQMNEDSRWLIRMVENLLLVTKMDSEKDKVEALDFDANDYVTKPFGTQELMARVRATLRSRVQNADTGAAMTGRYQLHDLQIDYDRRQVYVGGVEVKLTQTEYNILALLARHTGKVLTYTFIIREIWGAMDTGGVKRLQVNMANLRKKLGVKPGENKYIINELGVGYRMCEECL